MKKEANVRFYLICPLGEATGLKPSDIFESSDQEWDDIINKNQRKVVGLVSYLSTFNRIFKKLSIAKMLSMFPGINTSGEEVLSYTNDLVASNPGHETYIVVVNTDGLHGRAV